MEDFSLPPLPRRRDRKDKSEISFTKREILARSGGRGGGGGSASFPPPSASRFTARHMREKMKKKILLETTTWWKIANSRAPMRQIRAEREKIDEDSRDENEEEALHVRYAAPGVAKQNLSPTI